MEDVARRGYDPKARCGAFLKGVAGVDEKSLEETYSKCREALARHNKGVESVAQAINWFTMIKVPGLDPSVLEAYKRQHALIYGGSKGLKEELAEWPIAAFRFFCVAFMGVVRGRAIVAGDKSLAAELGSLRSRVEKVISVIDGKEVVESLLPRGSDTVSVPRLVLS